MIRLLYVDDETTLLEIGKIYLERDGSCLVDTITSAPAALALLESTTYDAIISDYEMSEMNGIEFLKIVRRSGNTSPFILFTGRGREEVVIQALNEGADFYLQKGGDPRSQFVELTHKIHQAVQQRKTEAIIRDHERLEADILDFLPDATFAIDRSGFVIAWNRAIEEMTGIAAVDMLGKGDFEYAIPFYGTRRKILIDLIFESPEVIRAHYSHIIQENDALIAETTLPRPQGKAVTLMGKASLLYDRLGNTIGAIESIRDITIIKSREEELQALNEEIMASQEELRGQYEDLTSTQEELRKQQEQLIGVASTVPGVIYQFYIHPDGSMGMNYVSSRAEEVFGFFGATKDFFEWFTTHVDPRDRDAFLRSIDEVVISGSPWRFEGRFITLSGRTIWFEGISNPVRHGLNRVYNGVMLDITDRKHAEAVIRESEEKYRILVETTRTGFVIVDEEGRVLDANPEYVRLTGHSSLARIIGRSVIEWTADGERERNAIAVRQCLREGTIRNFETDYIDSFGTITPIEINATVLQSEGSFQIHTLCRNISIRKQTAEMLRKNAEELHTAFEEMAATEEELRQNIDDLRTSEQALQESESNYRLLIEKAREGIIIAQDGIIQKVNLRLSEMLGISSKQLIGKPFSSYIHKDHRDLVATRHRQRIAEENVPDTYEVRINGAGGKVIWVALSASVTQWNGGLATLSMLTDITERKLAHEALQEIERIHTTMISNLPGFVYRCANDSNWTMEFISDGCQAITGYSPGELIHNESLTYNDLVHPDFQTSLWNTIQDFLEKNVVFEVEYPIITKTGEIRWVWERGRGIFSSDNQILYLEGFITDITRHRQAEEALRESEERYRALFLGAAEGILVVDTDTRRIIHANPVICRMLGYSDDNLIGMDLENIQPKEDFPQVIHEFEALVQREKSHTADIPCKKKDGTIVYTDVTSSRIIIDGMICIIGIFVDITERKQMEEALRQSNQRLRLLTGLTRHDILNHLTAIEGYHSLALETADHDAAFEYISRAQKTGKRIEATIGFTREYENFGFENSAWRPIFSIIESAKSEIERGRVIIENGVTSSLEVYADPIIRKVFSTLLENSVRHGETLSFVRFSASEGNGVLTLTCEDDGVGIPEEEKDMIFEHGYGKNTGIGLFLAREILSITGLSIRECGEEGNGARFEILVPAGKFRRENNRSDREE